MDAVTQAPQETPEPRVRRRVLNLKMKVKSEAMFLALRDNALSTLNNSMYRIGELYKLAERHYSRDILNQVNDWYIKNIINDVSAYSEQLKELSENLSNEVQFELGEMATPNMEITFEVIHNSLPELIKQLQIIDRQLESIEVDVLCGAGELDTIQQVKKHLKHQLDLISSKIFRVTTPGKRNGGPFNARYYLDQIRDGVFSMDDAMAGLTSITPDAAPINNEVVADVDVDESDTADELINDVAPEKKQSKRATAKKTTNEKEVA